MIDWWNIKSIEQNRFDEFRKFIWNEAIEEAAKHFEATWAGPEVIAAEIRKLRK